jgi:hypothetical protein
MALHCCLSASGVATLRARLMSRSTACSAIGSCHSILWLPPRLPTLLRGAAVLGAQSEVSTPKSRPSRARAEPISRPATSWISRGVEWNWSILGRSLNLRGFCPAWAERLDGSAPRRVLDTRQDEIGDCAPLQSGGAFDERLLFQRYARLDTLGARACPSRLRSSLRHGNSSANCAGPMSGHFKGPKLPAFGPRSTPG